jgi:hypothetical protein
VYRQFCLFDVPLAPCFSIPSNKGQIRWQDGSGHAVNPLNGVSALLGYFLVFKSLVVNEVTFGQRKAKNFT